MRKIIKLYRNNKTFIRLFVFIIIFPLIIGGVYSLPLKRLLDVECSDLLGFYGTSLGIFSSFVSYRYEKAREKREMTSKFKPQVFIDVIPNTECGYFTLKIQNLSKGALSSVYLYDKYVKKILDKSENFYLCFNKSASEVGLLSKELGNVVNVYDDNLIDDDGFPKYIQLCCDVPNGDIWNCCFDKRIDGCDIYYYPNFELL